MARKLYLLSCFLIGITGLAACIPGHTGQTSTLAIPPSQIGPSALSEHTPFNTPTLLPTWTPIPALATTQLADLTRLLTSGSCELPCYLGVTPGRTSWDEARGVMKGLGAVYRGAYNEAGYPTFHLTMRIQSYNQDGVAHSTVSDDIYHDVSFVIANGIVERIVATVQTNDVPLFLRYWAMYSLDATLDRLGPPDAAYVAVSPSGEGFGLTIVYNLGIAVEVGGGKADDNLCIGVRKAPAYLGLTLTDLESGLGLFDPLVVAPINRDVWTPLEEVLGINEEEFSRRVLADPSICFSALTPPN